MKAPWVGLGALAAVAAGGYLALRARIPDLGPAGPNRDLAPESLAVYVEAPDFKTTWSNMQATGAWRDFAGSKAAAALMDVAAVKDLVAAIDQVATKAAYSVDAANAMKFVGRECSVGAELDEKGGTPRLLVLTKLDVDALTKDLLKGKTDLAALWDELQRRTGQCDFVVTREEYRGHAVAVAARGDSKFHAALLGDTLAVSTDGALLRKAVDCRATHGERSLGRRPSFQTDVAATPAGATAFEWYDFDALDARRASLDAGLAALGASPEVVGAVHGVLDGVRGAHSCARSTALADGDLYKLTWTYSKSDLFADKAKPALRDLFYGDWVAYAEARDVGAVAKAWSKSALWRTLDAGEFGKWFNGLLDDPTSQFAELAAPFGGGAAAADPFDEKDDLQVAKAQTPDQVTAPKPPVPAPKGQKPGAAPTARPPAVAGRPPRPAPKPPVRAAKSPGQDAEATAKPPVPAEAKKPALDRFAARFGWHLVKDQIFSSVVGEAAIGIDAVVDKTRKHESPRVAAAVRLDTEARLIVLAALGARLASKTAGMTCEDVGERKVYGGDVQKQKMLGALVGDVFVWSNDSDLVRQAARSGDTKPLGPPPRVRDAAAGMKPGWRGFLYLDIERAMDAFKASSNSRSDRNVNDVLDQERASGLLGGQIAAAAYVPDDFSSIEVRTRYWMSDSKDPDWSRCLERSEPREPQSWTSLPDTTFAHITYPSSGVDMVWFLFKFLLKVGKGDLAAMETDFRESMGMDLEKELIPALGREVVFAVTYRAADPAAKPGRRGGEPFTLPGFVLGVEVKDTATVKRAVDRALEIAEEKLRENDASAPAKPFVREALGGAEIIRLELPPEAQESIPVHPALAFLDGFLFVSSDIDVLRAGIDAKNGKGKSLADTPSFVRATAALDKKCAGFELLDWRLMLDQLAVYAPQFGRMIPGAGPKYPDFPEDSNAQEWQRRVKEYEKQVEEAKTSGGAKVKKWIDSLRVVDFIGSSGRIDGRISDSVMVVKFAE